MLGYEASGIVDAVGSGVEDLSVGDRVSTIPAFSMVQYGVYGESAIVPAQAVAPYPETLSPAEGTSIWMQYMTAWPPAISNPSWQKRFRWMRSSKRIATWNRISRSARSWS